MRVSHWSKFPWNAQGLSSYKLPPDHHTKHPINGCGKFLPTVFILSFFAKIKCHIFSFLLVSIAMSSVWSSLVNGNKPSIVYCNWGYKNLCSCRCRTDNIPKHVHYIKNQDSQRKTLWLFFHLSENLFLNLKGRPCNLADVTRDSGQWLPVLADVSLRLQLVQLLCGSHGVVDQWIAWLQSCWFLCTYGCAKPFKYWLQSASLWSFGGLLRSLRVQCNCSDAYVASLCFSLCCHYVCFSA